MIGHIAMIYTILQKSFCSLQRIERSSIGAIPCFGSRGSHGSAFLAGGTSFAGENRGESASRSLSFLDVPRLEGTGGWG